ncbi:DUF6255 family natural product biosynthesis protein [Streptomyces syringium]|uniref:DUF6255 family natural product biosynthesis protein n=1 Tax=Streptomyces syringium TaxID=76729 RepID=UPI0037D8E938
MGAPLSLPTGRCLARQPVTRPHPMPVPCTHPEDGWTTVTGIATCGRCGTQRFAGYRALGPAIGLPEGAPRGATGTGTGSGTLHPGVAAVSPPPPRTD